MESAEFDKLPLYKPKKLCYNNRAVKQCTGGSMDRASDSGSEGWGFESLPVYQKSRYPFWDICLSRLQSKVLE